MQRTPSDIAREAISAIVSVTRSAVAAIHNLVPVDSEVAPVDPTGASPVIGQWADSYAQPTPSNPAGEPSAADLDAVAAETADPVSNTALPAGFDPAAPPTGMSPNDIVRSAMGTPIAAPVATDPTPNQLIASQLGSPVAEQSAPTSADDAPPTSDGENGTGQAVASESAVAPGE